MLFYPLLPACLSSRRWGRHPWPHGADLLVCVRSEVRHSMSAGDSCFGEKPSEEGQSSILEMGLEDRAVIFIEWSGRISLRTYLSKDRREAREEARCLFGRERSRPRQEKCRGPEFQVCSDASGVFEEWKKTVVPVTAWTSRRGLRGRLGSWWAVRVCMGIQVT